MSVKAFLFRLESKSKITHPVHGGVALTAPLSSKSLRLLKEFRLRYGVGEVFCKLSYLTYLVEYVIVRNRNYINA